MLRGVASVPTTSNLCVTDVRIPWPLSPPTTKPRCAEVGLWLPKHHLQEIFLRCLKPFLTILHHAEKTEALDRSSWKKSLQDGAAHHETELRHVQRQSDSFARRKTKGLNHH